MPPSSPLWAQEETHEERQWQPEGPSAAEGEAETTGGSLGSGVREVFLEDATSELAQSLGREPEESARAAAQEGPVMPQGWRGHPDGKTQPEHLGGGGVRRAELGEGRAAVFPSPSSGGVILPKASITRSLL